MMNPRVRNSSPIGSQQPLPLLGEFPYGWLIHEWNGFPALFISR